MSPVEGPARPDPKPGTKKPKVYAEPELAVLLALHAVAVFLAIMVMFATAGWQFWVAFLCLVWVESRLFTGNWLRNYRE